MSTPGVSGSATQVRREELLPPIRPQKVAAQQAEIPPDKSVAPTANPFQLDASQGERSLGAISLALTGFGVDPKSLSPEQQSSLLPSMKLALEHAGAAIQGRGVDLPEGVNLSIEGKTAEDGSQQIQIELQSPDGNLSLRAEIGADGKAQYTLDFQPMEGEPVHSEKRVQLSFVQVEDGSVVVAYPVRPDLPSLGEPSDSSEDAAAEKPARQEGMQAFLEGALYGSFDEDENWSSVAGQVGVGFIPVVGQAADVRDFSAAARDLQAGKPGAPYGLMAASLAFIPGLDFLKAGTRITKKAMKEAAETAMDRVAQEGLEIASKELSEAGAKQAVKSLRTLLKGRAELMVRLQDAVESGLVPGNGARAALNGLTENLKASELVGALRDRLGVPVPDPRTPGRFYDHLAEAGATLRSLENLRSALLRSIARKARNGADFGKESKLAEALREFIQRADDFMRLN